MGIVHGVRAFWCPLLGDFGGDLLKAFRAQGDAAPPKSAPANTDGLADEVANQGFVIPKKSEVEKRMERKIKPSRFRCVVSGDFCEYDSGCTRICSLASECQELENGMVG